MSTDTAQHMIRVPEERIIYIAANGGLYKLFPDTNAIELMLALPPGQQGHMIGYAELAQRPQAAGLIVGTIDLSPGGVYQFDSYVWTLHNNGLPPGRAWRAVAASPRSANHWIAFGSTAAGIGITGSAPGAGAAIGSAGGFMVDKTDGLSPLYYTTTGGAFWQPVPLPAPYLYIDSPSKISMPTPQIAYSDTGDLLIFGIVQGIGNFFGAAEPGLALWRGQPGALQVLSANPDNAATHPIGDTTSVSAYDLAAGASGAAILSANFGSRFGLPGLEIARISAEAEAVSYASSIEAQLRIDRRPGTNSAIGIVANSTAIYSSLDYETIPLSAGGTLNTAIQTRIAAAADGVYFGQWNSGGSGIWRISDPIGSPSATQVGAAGRKVSTIAASQQGQRPSIAAREHYDNATESGAPARFWLGSGSAWRSVTGPDGITNAQLSADERGLAALAIPISPTAPPITP